MHDNQSLCLSKKSRNNQKQRPVKLIQTIFLEIWAVFLKNRPIKKPPPVSLLELVYLRDLFWFKKIDLVHRSVNYDKPKYNRYNHNPYNAKWQNQTIKKQDLCIICENQKKNIFEKIYGSSYDYK